MSIYSVFTEPAQVRPTTMHEILTIQLGHRANHLAAHFWNTQESYFTYDSASGISPVDHDILFQPGLGPNGDETFTPRTLIYDLKGGFGGLRKWGGLYDQQLSMEIDPTRQGATGVWDGNVVLQQDPQIPRSDYQKGLDEGNSNPQALNTETVRYWSDFNRVFYHPRSVVQINDYELGSNLMPFEKFESGEELFANVDREENLLDRDLRPLAEECDQMQGIQVWASGDDAWGGFASRYAERLRDEFGKIGLWVWSTEEEKGRGSRVQRLLKTTNAARTLHEISMHASMYIPMSIPSRLPQYVHLDFNSQWHTSAMLSTALETMSLPSRLRPEASRRGYLSDMEVALNVNRNQRIAQLQCSILDPETQVKPTARIRGTSDHRVQSSVTRPVLEEDKDEDTNVQLDIDLSCGDFVSYPAKGHRVSIHTFGALDCQRGRLAERENDEEAMDEEDGIGYARKRARFAGKAIVKRYHTSLQYPLLDSFPQIYPIYDHTIAVRTSLATTSRISAYIKAIKEIIDKTIASDEREALRNGLGDLAEAYEEGWGGGDDSDDD